MRGLSIASLVLGILGLATLVFALFLPAGSMTGAQSDCTGDAPCFTYHERVSWTMYRETRDWQRDDNGTHTEDRTSRTWSDLESRGVPESQMGRLAGTMVWASFGLGLVGVILVLVGRYTHAAVGIVGGILGILVLPAAAGTGIMLWVAIDNAGAAFKKEIMDASLNWATNGPFPGIALILLGATGLLFLIAGILGLMPAGYRRDA